MYDCFFSTRSGRETIPTKAYTSSTVAQWHPLLPCMVPWMAAPTWMYQLLKTSMHHLLQI